MTRFMLIINLALLVPFMGFGGDEATLCFIGFSQDGRYLAFEQFGWFDGSGFPYSEIIFVNVPQNSFACAPVSVTLDEDDWDESASTRARELAQEQLRTYGIIEHNTGYHVTTQSRNEPDVNPLYVHFSGSEIPLDSLGEFFQYAVRLREIDAEVSDDHPADFGPAKMLELSIESPDIQEEYILQRDTELPNRRSYVLSYHISDVYLYRHAEDTHIAVFISYMKPGFEGPDFRYMVVTGTLY
jgi:predicted secreted protein